MMELLVDDYINSEDKALNNIQLKIDARVLRNKLELFSDAELSLLLEGIIRINRRRLR